MLRRLPHWLLVLAFVGAGLALLARLDSWEPAPPPVASPAPALPEAEPMGLLEAVDPQPLGLLEAMDSQPMVCGYR